MKKLVTVSNDFMAENLMCTLKEAGINGYIQYEGFGQYFRTMYGGSSYGKSIFVNERDYEAASRLLAQMNQMDGQDAEGIAEEDMKDYIRQENMRLGIFAGIMFLFVGVPLIYGGISYLMGLF